MPKSLTISRKALKAVLLASGILAGCSYLRSAWHTSEPPAPPPVAAAAATPTPTPAPHLAHKKRRHHHPHLASRNIPKAAVSPAGAATPGSVDATPTPNAAPTPEAALASPEATPAVTLAGEAPDPASSRVLLDEAGQRTRELDHAKLTAGQVALCGQINDLVGAGNDALTRHDYLAADSLAKKASALADQLPEPDDR